MGETLPDGTFFHTGQPQAGERLFAARLLVDKSEDQFSLTSGIATVHDAIHIWAVHQLLQNKKHGLEYGHSIKLQAAEGSFVAQAAVWNNRLRSR